MLAIAKNTLGSFAMVKNHKYDQEKSRIDFARMVILHNYPFNMAEHEYFEIFFNGIQPMFKLVSRNTVRYDVFKVHKIEKRGCISTLKNFLVGLLLLLIFGLLIINILDIFA